MQIKSAERKLLSEILDIELLNRYFQKSYKFTRIPITILDVDGEVIVASEWTRLCDEYMRGDSDSSQNCINVCSKIGEFDHGVFECPNGLCMHRVPIKSGNTIVAYLVLSQFFIKQPNFSDFDYVMNRKGVEKSKVLEALTQIPVVTEDEIQEVIELFNDFAILLHDMIERKMRAKELEEEVMQSYEELEASYQDISSLNDQLSLLNIELLEKNKAISYSERRYRDLFKKMNQGALVLNRNKKDGDHSIEYIVLEMNPAMKSMKEKQKIIDFAISNADYCIENKRKIQYHSKNRYYEIECTMLSTSEILVYVSDISSVYEKLSYERSQMWSLVEAMGKLVEKRDLYTADHQKQVAILAVRMAKEMGLREEQIESVYIASLLHDIGKISIPAEILTKPDRLTDIEYELIKTHVVNAFDILNKINFSLPIVGIVMQHHERLDGTGYPKVLNESEICIEAKIVAVADVYEAITSHRPYRPSLGEDFAKTQLNIAAGTLYDKRVVEACVKVVNRTKWRNEDIVQYMKNIKKGQS